MENNEHFCIIHTFSNIFHTFSNIFHIFRSIPTFLWVIITILILLLYTLGWACTQVVKDKRNAINYKETVCKMQYDIKPISKDTYYTIESKYIEYAQRYAGENPEKRCYKLYVIKDNKSIIVYLPIDQYNVVKTSNKKSYIKLHNTYSGYVNISEICNKTLNIPKFECFTGTIYISE